MKTIKRLAGAAVTAVAAMAVFAPNGDACTRVRYTGEGDLQVIGRSLDWKTPIPTNIYVYPAGIEKVGNNVPGAVRWKSKYGAVYAVGYDGGITEGMNEKGLVVNGLFCKGTVYNNGDTEGRPAMSLAVFVGWLLDMNATTDEVIEVLKERNFTISGATFDGGTVSTLHWGVTDASGKSIVFEFVDGDLKIHDMGDFRAMTNDPTWTQMTAIMDYWNGVGGKNMLPGTVRSSDRCVRANYFAHHVKPVADVDTAVSITRSVLQVSSVPYTYLIEGEPNLSSTQWRSYAVPSAGRYYFDIVTNPGIYYVDLNKINLKPGASVMKLDTSKETQLVGEANRYMKKSEGFTPMF